MTRTKIALAAVLFAATSSAAFAQFDPDLSNRYQGYAQPNTYGYSASGKLGTLAGTASQSAAVSLQKHRNVLLQSGPVLQQREVALPITGAATSGDWFELERGDRASSPFAGGN